MTFEIRITDVAESNIQQAFEWWRDNRSPDETMRWYEGIYPAITTLQHMPHGCALAQ